MTCVPVIGSDFELTTGLSSPSGQHRPKIAFDGVDTYLVVWEQGQHVYGNSVAQIYAARIQVINGTATALDASGIPLSVSAYTQELPKVSYGGGKFLVAWQQFDGASYEIKGVTVTSAGVVSSVIVISEATAYNQITPDICYDSTNSRFWVVWADFRGFVASSDNNYKSSDTTYQIYGAYVTPAGSVGTNVCMLPYLLSYHFDAYDFTLFYPVIQTNGVILLLSFSGRDRFAHAGVIGLQESSTSAVCRFDLNGTMLGTGATSSPTSYPVHHQYNAKIAGVSVYDAHDENDDPIGEVSTTSTNIVSNSILTDGANFLCVYNTLREAHNTYNQPRFWLHGLYVTSAGTTYATSTPNNNQTVDSKQYAPNGCGIWADPYYYMFWEGIGVNMDTVYPNAFGPVVHNIYCGRITKTGSSAPDYYSRTAITSSASAMAMNPAAAKGAGAEAVIVYEEDDMAATPTWKIKARVLSLSALSQDGEAPEQIAVFLPGTSTSAATMRFKLTTEPTTWTTGHSLYKNPDGHAWVITGLTPGSSYNVEVTLDGIVYSAVMTTRALPPAAGTATKNITSDMTLTQANAVLASAVPGDVVQINTGNYSFTGALTMPVSGTAASPIYVRGQSRTGTIIHRTDTGTWWDKPVVVLSQCSDVIWENMTLQGDGVDKGTAPSSVAIQYTNGGNATVRGRRLTIRNIVATGVDGFVGVDEANQSQCDDMLVYNNTATGNNTWTQDLYEYDGFGAPEDQTGITGTEVDIDENVMWNDDGIHVSGIGIAVFQNTLSGFGDALCMSHSGTQRGIHFFRNLIPFTGDDALEADYGGRNITYYDNQIPNAMTFLSCDAYDEGPLIAFRNISLNSGRQALKWPQPGPLSGVFLYNNTLIRTHNEKVWMPADLDYAILQNSSMTLSSWGFQNNICLYVGASLGSTGRVMAIQASPDDPIDFSYNTWWPDGDFQWINCLPNIGQQSLADTHAGLNTVTPIFSGSNRRHGLSATLTDNICDSANPFATALTLYAGHHAQVSTYSAADLAVTSSSACHNMGVAIVGITDGYSGAAPDRGAIIAGRAAPVWGDQT